MVDTPLRTFAPQTDLPLVGSSCRTACRKDLNEGGREGIALRVRSLTAHSVGSVLIEPVVRLCVELRHISIDVITIGPHVLG